MHTILLFYKYVEIKDPKLWLDSQREVAERWPQAFYRL